MPWLKFFPNQFLLVNDGPVCVNTKSQNTHFQFQIEAYAQRMDVYFGWSTG